METYLFKKILLFLMLELYFFFDVNFFIWFFKFFFM